MARILLLLLVERHPPLDQAEPAEHRGEQIVEIVRDPAGQLADRVHLAGLDQLALELLAVGDVEQGAGKFDRLAVGVAQQHRLVEEMLVLAVGAAPAILDRNGPCSRRALRSPR